MDMERQQELEDCAAMRMTEEQRQALQGSFTSVKCDFQDLDGMQWSRRALRSRSHQCPSPPSSSSSPYTSPRTESYIAFAVLTNADLAALGPEETVRASASRRYAAEATIVCRPASDPDATVTCRAGLPPADTPLSPPNNHRNGTRSRSPVKGLFPGVEDERTELFMGGRGRRPTPFGADTSRSPTAENEPPLPGASPLSPGGSVRSASMWSPGGSARRPGFPQSPSNSSSPPLSCPRSWPPSSSLSSPLSSPGDSPLCSSGDSPLCSPRESPLSSPRTDGLPPAQPTPAPPPLSPPAFVMKRNFVFPRPIVTPTRPKAGKASPFTPTGSSTGAMGPSSPAGSSSSTSTSGSPSTFGSPLTSGSPSGRPRPLPELPLSLPEQAAIALGPHTSERRTSPVRGPRDPFARSAAADSDGVPGSGSNTTPVYSEGVVEDSDGRVVEDSDGVVEDLDSYDSEAPSFDSYDGEAPPFDSYDAEAFSAVYAAPPGLGLM